MKGTKNIEVSHRGIHYTITVTRNIAIIRGDSGTEKQHYILVLNCSINVAL